MNTPSFNQNDWNHLHDVIIDSSGKDFTQAELETFFAGLPKHLQGDAYSWGMADTDWRIQLHRYLVQNPIT